MSRICIGKIVAAHGVKGLVKILPFCEDVTLLSGQLFVDETRSARVTIHLKNKLGKYILAEIQGVNTREQAEKTKCSLFVSCEALPPPEDGVFYVHDLIGRVVLNAQHENIGTIRSVENYGASDILDIRLKNGQDVMVPLTDNFVLHIADDHVIVQNYDAFL